MDTKFKFNNPPCISSQNTEFSFLSDENYYFDFKSYNCWRIIRDKILIKYNRSDYTRLEKTNYILNHDYTI